MDILKPKEESEVVKITLDPESGVTIENANFNCFDCIDTIKTTKARTYEDSHKNKDQIKSELLELDTFKKEPDHLQDELSLEEYTKEYTEVLVSIDDFLEFLDSNEEHIDV